MILTTRFRDDPDQHKTGTLRESGSALGIQAGQSRGAEARMTAAGVRLTRRLWGA
jgi:hypothetical protein